MRLLVTGGAGYLGSEVMARAVASGWDVTAAWLRREPPAGRSLRLGLADAAAVDAAFRDVAPEAVIHTAYRQAEDHLERDVLAATANVAHASRAARARLLHLSTDLVFDGERDGRYAEDDEPRPVSAYGRAKLEAERLVREISQDALVVRTSLLYGKAGGPQEALALRDDVSFHTDEIRTPIDVADLAAALLELAAMDRSGVLHVAGPDALNRRDFARLLAAAQGRDPDEICGAPSPPGAGRARNVALDSSRVAGILRTRLRGVEEALGSLHS